MLSPQQQELWDAYLEAEGGAPRSAKLQVLEAFVEAIEASPPRDLAGWVYDVVEAVVDKDMCLHIRMPLFRRVIFPVLREGLLNRRPGCARWLVALSQQLHGCPECREQLPPDNRSERGLLRTAMEHEPENEAVRFRLIEILSNQLHYSLHELPAGVLYGSFDGATPAQCLELQDELEEFCELIEAAGQGEQYKTLVVRCRIHFQHYRKYLLHRGRYDSYSDYLKRHELADEA